MTTAVEKKSRKQSIVDDLRAMADFIENVEFPNEQRIAPNVSSAAVYIFCDTKEEFGATCRRIGEFEKSAGSVYVDATKHFGEFRLQVSIQRNLACERVKVGEKVIPAKPETVLPAQPEKVEDVYEWKCPDSFLALAQEAAEEA